MVGIEQLRSVELFQDLDDVGLAELAAASEQRPLQRGDVLFTENDEPNELFVVVSGRLAMVNRAIPRSRRYPASPVTVVWSFSKNAE